MSDQKPALLEVSGIRKHFRTRGTPWRGNRAVQAVTDVSFSIPRGQALGLVGESGSGKSTIARCVLGLEKVDAGSVNLLGSDITRLRGPALRSARRNLQAVFQDPASSLNPRWTIARTIADPLLAYGMSASDAARKVIALAERVGLDERQLTARPHELSGGQQQRAAIARALTLEPALIVADEPLSALDVSIQAQVLNVLVDLKRTLGQSYLFISHDLRVTRHLCETIAVCYLGSIVEIGPADEVLTNPKHPYTAALVSAMPLSVSELGKPRERIVLVGELPSPLNPPSGCRFRTRCFRATEECALQTPTLEIMTPSSSDATADHRAACFFPISNGSLT